jgi:signal transduction histidine kinase/DNA-binding NarL/FixJ family response regulator
MKRFGFPAGLISGRAAARDPQSRGSGIRAMKLEALILLLLAATVASIPYHDQLLRKRLVIDPANSASYELHGYGDALQGGTSTIATDPKQPLSWSCNLAATYQYYFCGYEIIFDKDHVGRGADLSRYEAVDIKFSYEGNADWVRFYLKNFDPRYSRLKDLDSVKYNKVEFTTAEGPQQVHLKLSDLSVADWWIINYKIPPSLSRPQFDNIVAIDIQPGTGAKPGLHHFKVESITFEGALLTQAQWYLFLLAFWVVVITMFLASRFINQRRQFELRHQLQLLESRQLAIAKTAAENASRAKSEFLANMSHELRTPLNAILGYAQILEREDLTARQATAARTIHRSGEHLLTLITDVLDLAKIEAGRLELVADVTDLPAVVNSIGDMMRVRAEEKGLCFTCAVPDWLPHHVMADEKRLRQVLINLLGNAVKFTEGGEVALAIARVASPDGKDLIRFEVRDTGPGIAATKLAAIFQPFEQAGDHEGRATGTGLGLSISRQIVELMGSVVEVESEEGKGSRFWFDLELPRAGAPANLAVPAIHAPRAIGEGRRLLIVDDIDENRAVLADMLGQLGFDTRQACNGAEAVAAAAAECPDLILMDMRMPVMDGFEAIARLRCLPDCTGIPIIALSASATTDFETRSIAAGADAFLTKPVALDTLAGLLAHHLGVEAAAATEDSDAAAHAGPIIAPPPQYVAKLLKLAQQGNMRAVRREAEQIIALDDKYRPFGEALIALAIAYQSPAILKLIQQHSNSRQAA